MAEKKKAMSQPKDYKLIGRVNGVRSEFTKMWT